MKFAGPVACFIIAALSLPPARADSGKYYTYITDLGPDFVELAWGTADGFNTIGRSSASHGEATIHIAGRTITSRPNYVRVAALAPDREYTYDIQIGGDKIGEGKVRTWAAKDDKLVFFVIGDFGNGGTGQYRIAEVMRQEFDRLEKAGAPVRFTLSVGDNIYGNISTFAFGVSHTGAADSDWAPKFFEPYAALIARIPFFGTLGNHDGNATESRGDLTAYLDNFAFPGGRPARYYTFTYGGLATFFGLDSTDNTESGPPRPVYLDGGDEFRWMKTVFAEPKAAWAIPYFHHPPFSAGPLHNPSLHALAHWVDLFAASGVKVVFTGHEHNFQASAIDASTKGIEFFVSGAGGELRSGDVTSKMQKRHIAAWAQQNHFLVVEITGKTMKVTPVGFEKINVRDSSHRPVAVPFTVTLP